MEEESVQNFKKETVKLDDGRYLIYYEFRAESECLPQKANSRSLEKGEPHV